MIRLFGTCALLVLSLSVGSCGSAKADIRVAVSSNFLKTAELLAAEYEKVSPHRVEVYAGSSGKLAAQAANGAPVDIFLSADSAHVENLKKSSIVVESFDYAIGHGVLLFPDGPCASKGTCDLKTSLEEVETLAIANPDVAPYGRIAQRVIPKSPSFRVVNGENVSQAYQMVLSGAADAGIVALSQVISNPSVASKQYLRLKDDRGIRQKAALINDSETAKDFFNFLKSDTAVSIIEKNGYDTPDD